MKAVCRFALAAVLCAVTAQGVAAQQPAPAKDPQAAAPTEVRPLVTKH